MDSVQYYINQYKKSPPENLPGFIRDIKERAMESLTGKSFPSPKDEKYLYTRLSSVFEKKPEAYCPSMGDFPDGRMDKIMESDLPAIDSYRIILYNGYYRGNGPVHELPGGFVLGSFMNMAEKYDSVCRQSFSAYGPSGDIFANLNAMLSGDGFFLFVPAGGKPAKPIQVMNILDEKADTLIQPRNMIVMEQGSSANVFLCDCTLSDNSLVCNDVTEILLGEGASLNLTRLQDVNKSSVLLTRTDVRQPASSRMKTHYVSLNGGMIRNNLSVILSGKDAEHIAGGLSFTENREHTDNDVKIVHSVHDCRSNQLFKCILADNSTSAYTGRIVVEKDARKTLAYQRSGNILLHPGAKMNIRPQLEIYADDVKCSHGATAGQLDAEALFYLRSRGVGEKEARKLLLGAFAGEVINEIGTPEIGNLIGDLAERKLECIFRDNT